MRGVMSVVEDRLQGFFVKFCGDVLVFFEQGEEGLFAAAFPDFHGVALDNTIGVLAANARLGQGEQDALGEDEAAGFFQIILHRFGVDEELVDYTCQPCEGEIERHARVRADVALYGRVRDIAFVPERDVLHGGNDHRAHEAGEARQVFGEDRVALVRHGRRALLARREKFLRFSDFGSLEVADFGGEVFNRAGDHAEGREEHGVAVAGDNLRGHGFGLEAHLFGDVFLHFRGDGGVSSDRAGDGADGDFLAGGFEALLCAFEGGVVAREFQAEGCRFGVDAMGAADAERVFMFLCPAFQGGQQLVEIVQQDIGGLGQLLGEAGVHHIGAGHALMDVAAFGADKFGDGGEEGDDIVFDFGLDFVDALDVEIALFAQSLGRAFGDGAHLRHFVGGVGFDLQPYPEAVFRLEDCGHFLAGVTGDHLNFSCRRLSVVFQRFYSRKVYLQGLSVKT